MNANLPSPLDPQACWQAVQARDAAFDGRFVYAVLSTGIFCRPSCPSRRPGPDKVRYFRTSHEAIEAGFRPCRRCLPEQELSPRGELVERASRILAGSVERLSLADLGSQLGVSPFHLQRVFKATTGLSPRQYAAGLRAGRLKRELRAGSEITPALYEAGYGSSSRLYAEADDRLGMSPAAYRAGGIHMHIRYSVTDSPLGRLLVGSTARGVCAVSLGDHDAGLEEMLRAEYPAATLERSAEADPAVAAILAYLSGGSTRLDLPLDVQATAFQLRVWEELRRIPYGETRTYTQVAAAIGRPAAVRAVANACGANPAALVTPCHRVVRADGSMGGYRWGLERKRALLKAEAR